MQFVFVLWNFHFLYVFSKYVNTPCCTQTFVYFTRFSLKPFFSISNFDFSWHLCIRYSDFSKLSNLYFGVALWKAKINFFEMISWKLPSVCPTTICNVLFLDRKAIVNSNAVVSMEATTASRTSTRRHLKSQRHILIKINKDKPTVLEVEVSEGTNGITNSKKCLMTEL